MNLNPLYPLTEDEATELVACVLTSSTIERYWRCLAESSAARRLHAELRNGTADLKALLGHGWFFRAQVLESPLRTEWEVPLALITLVLGQTAVAGVEDFLLASAVSDRPQMRWLGGLSRKILGMRSSSNVELPQSYQSRLEFERMIDGITTDATTDFRRSRLLRAA
jgi:hypothetical protein